MKWYGTTMRWFSALVMVCTLEAAQAARPVVVDELPGLPGQPASYWHAVRGEQEAAQAVSTAARNEAANVFFTGKPYDADLEGYLFQFRTYRPDVARWTSADPSGFPDGANGFAYNVVPTSEIDSQGLKSVAWAYASTSLVEFSDNWNSAGGFMVEWETARDNMRADDAAWSPSPNYLSDGDSFEFRIVSSLSRLQQVCSEFDAVYLMAHGNTTTYPGYAPGVQVWGMGSELYTDADFSGISHLAGWHGCTITLGKVYQDQVAAWFLPATRGFLYE